MLKETAARKAAENYKKYHIEAITLYNGVTVATSANYEYKVVILSDNSAALYCIAKPGSGCANCHYCGIDRLAAHVAHLKKLGLKRVFDIITAPGFFKALQIEL